MDIQLISTGTTWITIYKDYAHMTPEEKARQKIDRMFTDAGWDVIDRKEYSVGMTAVAIREGLLKDNKEADYFLFLNGKAVGVLEAKRAEVDVTDQCVCEQAEDYARNVPPCYPSVSNPLPIVMTSNGRELYMRDMRKPESSYDSLAKMPSPKKFVGMLGIDDPFAGLPSVPKKGLRECQFEAITNLEASFRIGHKKALMVLATGAGKTYTACMAAYRMLAHVGMKRVLFLVDRNNLGKQAEGEFGTFRLTQNGDAFTTVYGVSRLKNNEIPSDSNVIISTVQRLFAFLKGESITDDSDEESTADGPAEVTLPDNPKLPHDYFDMIIIDECHRSIYGNWKKVLEYFDTARLVGLTATPVDATLAFFNKNIVVNYTLEQSILDGVNVGHRVYSIKTEATTNGGAIRKGDKLLKETKYTGTVEVVENNENSTYTKEELNRSIINPAQIKLVLETFRDSIYTDMFPEREPNMDYIPKTLIFALNEAHAINIVKIVKEVFGREDDKFVQKITYSCGDSSKLIKDFRNDKDFRIAVTCTLVATGTDVRPLEVVMFMRDVSSLPLYIQMKGRGVRTIGDEALRNVTPNADTKDCFYLVDCVGVVESAKGIPAHDEEMDQRITLKKLLEEISHGYIPDEYLNRLAGVLARLHNKANEEQRNEFILRSHGMDMRDLAARLYQSLENQDLPPFIDVNQPNLERKELVSSLSMNPKAREWILILAAGFVSTLQPGEDNLISKGFSVEDASATTQAFEEYCRVHADEIEALRIIYNNEGTPITFAMLQDLKRQMEQADNGFRSGALWNSYAVLQPDKVKRYANSSERESLTNIIQLVRFAFRQFESLESVVSTAKQYFNLWMGQNQRNLTPKQREIISQVVDYIASNGACSIDEIKEDDKTHAAQLIKAFGTKQNANAALDSLFSFIVFRKKAA